MPQITCPSSNASTSSKNRIALFLYSLDGGGAERVIANLASNFVKQGVDVDMVLVRAKGPYLSSLPSTVRVIELKASKTQTSLFDLIRYLHQERPAVLLSAMHYANEVALWAKRLSRSATRVIVSEHNTLSRYARNTSRTVEKLTPLWARLFYPWADGIVAVSQGVARDLQQVTGLPTQRIKVIYNPVQPNLSSRAQAPIEHPWFALGEPPVILGMGRLVGQKDFPTLIRAFALVRQVRAARLVILGRNAGSESSLKVLIQDLGLNEDVAMLGFVDNPYAYMARSAVFVLSSRWEGLPLVLVEALSVDTPVVSTNCESGPAEILNHGQYGDLVPVGNHQAMADAILNVLSGNTKSVSADWLAQFDLETVAQQYLEVLNVQSNVMSSTQNS
jgi:glycosyltransferase involved in cell wall biosynthesis